MRPNVSIIVTVYKRTQFLSKALDSIFAQTYNDYEVIMVDDSGEAASWNIVKTYGNAKPIKYLANVTNLGVVRSLLRAIEAATAINVAILNDDDLWHPEFLERLVPPLEADSNLVLAFSDHWVMNTAGERDTDLSSTWSQTFSRHRLPAGVLPNVVETAVVRKAVPTAIASVFRRDAFDWSLLSPSVGGAYDYWISCLLAATRRPIYYIANQLAGYRLHAAMESVRRGVDTNDGIVFILSELRRLGWFPECNAFLRKELSQALLSAARNKRDHGLQAQARQLFWRSFLLHPTLRSLGCAVDVTVPVNIRGRLASIRTVRQAHNNPLLRTVCSDSAQTVRSASPEQCSDDTAIGQGSSTAH
jgi:glycosyltransferase involved in cell wall biosynthesis